MQKELEQAITIMKDNGLKYTQKRSDILSFLIDENRYVGALDVFNFMNSKYQGVSYDTIYRNLRDFAELNILEETELQGEKRYRFHCDVHGEHHHHHFICTSCGATREIHMCPMDMFQEQLPGCLIEGHKFEILGKCENCLKN